MSPEARALPRVIVEACRSALRLCALNAAAERLGLHAGLPLADARARFPMLAVEEADPQADARLLDRLADACERYTPLLALDGPDGLLLDVTGCAHLFGGEAGLVRDLLERLRGQGFAARAVLAGTAGAAFALSRFPASGARPGVVVPAEEDLAPLLAGLPLAALRLDALQTEALARLGLRRVGDLLGRPRAPLAARFGAGLPGRIEAVLGLAPVAVAYRFPPPVFCAERNLFDPVERVEDVLGLTLRLAAALAPALERHGLGARRLDLALFRVDGQVTRLAVGSGRPLRDPQTVRRLFAEKIATLSCLEPGFGFDLLRLAVREAAPLAEHQPGFAVQGDGAEALDGLIDRLAVRFGAPQVQVPVIVDSHWPEAAAGTRPAQDMGAAALIAAAGFHHPPSPPCGGTRGERPDGGRPGTRQGGGEPAQKRQTFEADAAVLSFPSPPLRRHAEIAPPPLDPLPPPLDPPPLAGEGALMRETEAGAPVSAGIFMRSIPAPAGGAASGTKPRSARTRSSDGAPEPLPWAQVPPDLCGPGRPLRLFEAPEPVEAVAEVPDGAPSHFHWRRRRHDVVRAEGPERIAGEWWRRGPAVAAMPTRDYFRVETAEGHRFWLFRAGLYGREPGAPRWFLHGLFG